MLFNSLEFLLFLPLVVLTYYLLPNRFRWVLLLGASYFFYMYWNPVFIILIVLSTIVDYIAGISIEKTTIKKKRIIFLIASLVINLGLLFVFKYFNFFMDTFFTVVSKITTQPNTFQTFDLLLPVGISFYTFQTLSYTIDVFRKKRKAERHLGYFAVYVAFFPQLVAGPIERSDRLIPQLKKKHIFNYNDTINALLRIAWGFFKKLVIADRIAVVVDTIFGNLQAYRGIYLIIAVIAFTIQIYCDFSAYSDIAIGSAKLMGIDLIENFKMPFFSKSIKEFWTRWHISLSSWFKDYVYFPLGGNRNLKKWHKYRNILIVFVVSGLWHGANINFIIWGFIHGAYITITGFLKDEVFSKVKWNFSLPTPIRQLGTFLIFSFSMLFFRAGNIYESIYIIRHMFDNTFFHFFNRTSISMGLEGKEVWVLVIFICWLFTAEGIKYYRNKDQLITGDVKQALSFIFLVGIIVIFGVFGEYDAKQFIYFQF